MHEQDAAAAMLKRTADPTMHTALPIRTYGRTDLEPPHLPRESSASVTRGRTYENFPSDPSAGLTSRQAWDLAHTRRCDGCGAWEIVTEIELRMRANEQWPVLVGLCEHVEAAYMRAEEAS